MGRISAAASVVSILQGPAERRSFDTETLSSSPERVDERKVVGNIMKPAFGNPRERRLSERSESLRFL